MDYFCCCKVKETKKEITYKVESNLWIRSLKGFAKTSSQTFHSPTVSPKSFSFYKTQLATQANGFAVYTTDGGMSWLRMRQGEQEHSFSGKYKVAAGSKMQNLPRFLDLRTGKCSSRHGIFPSSASAHQTWDWLRSGCAMNTGGQAESCRLRHSLHLDTRLGGGRGGTQMAQVVWPRGCMAG